MTSVARRREQDDSGEYSDASQDIEQNNSGNDGGPPESDYDSRGSDSEHSDREDESQEGQTERRVDDDEDRSNPQYIPKRGTFYEHDDRTAASGEESTNVTSDTASEKKEGSETPSERRRAPRKSETTNKWSHDKYNENEQMPKSRDELVAIYGYDIRNEDAPPHARRNRRYGRGPNKYTRTWEDEEAYKRQTAAAAQHRKPPNPEDFPELDGKFNRRPRARPRSKSQPASNESSENGSQLRRNASIKTPKGKSMKPQNASRPVISKPSPKPAPGKESNNLPPLENLTITATVFNNSHGPQRKVSSAPVAQQRPVPTEQAKRKPPPQAHTQPAPATAPSKQQQQPPQQQQQTQQKTQQSQQTQQAPAGTEQRGGSKRYSSLRQRPLAETYSPQQRQQPQQKQQQPQQQLPQQQQNQQPQQQPHRYHGDYVAGGQPPPQHQGSPVPQIHPQQMIHPVHRTPPVSQPGHGPSPPHQLPPQHPPQVPIAPVLDHTQQQVRLGILEQQQMVSHPHHGMHQPHSIGQLPPAQGYAPPAIMPAQYMQQQSNSGAVYGGALYQPPAAYPHQMYPHHNYKPNDMNIFQQATQAGGVTYYSCAEQEQLPRAQRRPTAAIPIVKPAAPEKPANPSEKDNIDRIVENMFVRKPWPATHGADSKDKPADQSRSSQEPPSKESSQPNSLTSSSISTDSKPSEPKEEERESHGNPAVDEKQEASA